MHHRKVVMRRPEEEIAPGAVRRQNTDSNFDALRTRLEAKPISRKASPWKTMDCMNLAIIEDNESVRNFMVRRAESERGVTVVAQASEANEAVDAVLRTNPDVVLLDLHLKKGSGLDVLTRIRGHDYEGVVFVFSSNDRAIYEPLLMQRGADGFYDKAFDCERLLIDLKALSSGGATRSAG